MSERQNIEWKQSWHDDYLKWVCGFANAIGGTIYIGKNDKGNVIELPDYQKLLEDIPNKIRNSMGIICDVQLLEEAGKKFIEIKVNPYSVPVSLRGRYYYRSGSSKMELTGVELNEFLLKKAGKTWDDVVEESATVKDIDEASVRKFIEDSKDKARMPDTKGLSVFQILEKLQLTEGKKIKRAALCLFGNNPGKFYPNVEVRIGRFGNDATDLRFQEVVEGNLVQLLDGVQVQLNNKFLVRPVSFEGMHRIEKDAYPLAALREMLLNALVHRTYMGSHTQLRVFDDRLSIWNEGTLPYGLTIDDLKKEHNSRPRNPKIAKACFMAGYIDTWGRGTLKVIQACKEAGLAEPQIEETNGGISVTLFQKEFGKHSEDVRNKFGISSEQLRSKFGTIAERKNMGHIHNSAYFHDNYESITTYLNAAFGITSEKLRKSFGLTSDKKMSNPANALVLISMFPEITAEQIGKILGVSERSAETYIKKLKSEGLIERIGGKKEGTWQIIPSN
jgi:ATP-dependent DNA helicase RecG